MIGIRTLRTLLVVAIPLVGAGSVLAYGSVPSLSAPKSVPLVQDATKLPVESVPMLWSLRRRQDLAQGRVALSPDGRWLAFTGSDGPVLIWDMVKRTPIRTLSVSSEAMKVSVIAISPDGLAAAVGTNGGVVALWNTTTGKIQWQRQIGHGQIWRLAFDDSGQRLAAAVDFGGSIQVLDRADGHEQSQIRSKKQDRITDFVFGRHGERLFYSSTDGTIRAWDLASRSLVGQLITAGGPVELLTLSPDGQTLAADVKASFVMLWNTTSGRPAAAPLEGYGASGISGMAFTSDGTELMIADTSGGDSLVKWRTGYVSAEGVADIGDGPTSHTLFSNTSDLVVTAGHNSRIAIWSADLRKITPALVAQPRPYVPGFFWGLSTISANGRVLALDGKTVTVRDFRTGNVVQKILLDYEPYALALSPDGAWLAVDGQGGARTQIYSVRTGQRTVDEHIAPGALAFSPHSKRLALSFGANYLAAGLPTVDVDVIDCATGRSAERELGNVKQIGKIGHLLFSPTGKLLYATTDNGIYTLDANAQDANYLATRGSPWPGEYDNASLAISPDGRRLAVTRGNEVVLLDAATGTQIADPLLGGGAPTFTADGRYLLTSAFGGKLALWRVSTGENMGRVDLHSAQPIRTLRLDVVGGHIYAFASAAYAPGLGQPGAEAWEILLRPPTSVDTEGNSPGERSASPAAIPVPKELSKFNLNSLGSDIDADSTRLEIDGGLDQVAFASKGRVLRLVGETLEPVTAEQTLETVFKDAVVSPDGRYVAFPIADEQVAVYELRTGRLRNVFDGPEYSTTYAFLPQGDLAVARGTGVAIVDPGSGRDLRLVRYPAPADASLLVASGTAPQIAVATQGGTLFLGSTDSADEPLKVVHRDSLSPISAATFSTDGRILAAGGEDGRIELFDVTTGAEIGRPRVAHLNPVSDMIFSPSGDCLFSGSSDGTVRMWNLRTDRPLTFSAVGHTGAVVGLNFDTASGQLLSFGSDAFAAAKMRAWRVPACRAKDDRGSDDRKP
ncbi:MAG: WD40 repeat domain-containing protein [Steroidobacteraceae bacterium]